MNRTVSQVSDRLHGVVYAAMIALAVLLVLSVWSFAGAGYQDFVLAVVTGLVAFAVGLPMVLWRLGRRKRNPGSARGDRESFHDWARGDFETRHGRLKGVVAAVEILLPIAAVAFGMAAFAIVLHFAVPGAV
jgi:hypothetical protein